MAIYRGPGGSGDATNDASSETRLAVEARDAAIAAKVAAEAARDQALVAETNAETAETNAETAETNAETAVTAAQLAETNAETAQAAAEAAQAAAETAQTAAELAETNAETAETNAETAASTATTQAGIATTKAGEAASSASAAATSASNAAASYDAFDDRYLGAKSSNPTVDNDGNALITGALYFNTTVPETRVWNGSAWLPISAAGATVTSFNTRSGDVTLSSSDVTTALTYTPLAPSAIGTTVQAYDAQLADVASLTPSDNGVIIGNGTNFVVESGATLRTSLGLGTAATTAATDYATAAQGAKADTALQPAAIGVSVQAYDADLDTWATKTAPSGTVVGTSDTQTLTNKTIALGSNTVSGTLAQFNTAVTDADFASIAGTETLTNKTLTSPTINGSVATTGLNFDSNTFVIDATNNRVGVGTASPAHTVDIQSASGGTTARLRNTTGNFIDFIETSGSTRTGYIGTTNGTNFVIHNDKAGQMQFDTNNTERMRIDSSGNVGIGTSSPSYALDVNGVIKGNNLLALQAGTPSFPASGLGWEIYNNSSTDNFIQSYNRTGSVYMNSVYNALSHQFRISGTERMRLDSSGNLGLGVTPSAWYTSFGTKAFQFAGSGALYGFDVSTSDRRIGLMNNGFLNSSGGFIYTNTGHSTVYIQNAGAHQWFNAPSGTAGNAITFTQAMTLSAAGGLSVGTTSDAGAGNFRASGVFYSGDGSVSNNAFARAAGAGTGMYFPAANTVGFSTSATERMRIDSSGNLLVNRTSRLNNGKIEVLASTSEQAVVAQVQSNANSLFQGFNASGTAVFTTTGNGYLRATGTINFPSVYSTTSASAANVFVDSAGDLFRSTSSLKYKTDVQNTTHGLAEVMALRAVTYKGKSDADGDKVFGGLIAEEVHEAGLTEFVQYADDGTPDALAYGNMVSLAFKAIQELKAEVDSLKAQLNK